MKITQVMLSKGFGGAERYFVDLSLAQGKLGHEVQVICHKNFTQISRLRAAPGLHIDTVAPLGWWDLLARRRIGSAIARHRPEVVQAHLARGAFMAGKTCTRLNIPLVVKLHNYVDLKYYSHADCLIATTADQKNWLLDHGIASGNISVIPNFSSLQPVPVVTTSGKEELTIAAYGRLVRKKGFHVLLRAFRSLLDTGKKAVLRIGGDGPERRALAALCMQLGLDQHVQFWGWVEDVRAFAQTADLFVLPSLDEPFGIALLEMMALGMPIVATRTQGPMEILDDDCAWLIAAGDVTALASALIDAADHGSKRTARAMQALHVFRTRYAESVVVPQIVSLYQSLIAARSKQVSFTQPL
ncbi:MAG: glycosyltransferase [Gammaproteobacteria bacterium]